MKPEIHPKYYQANVKCACGNEFVVGSTRKEMKLDICSACHPFFTGKQKFVDTAGRVDKFFRKYGDEAQAKFQKKKKVRRVIRDEADIQAMLAEEVEKDKILDEVAAEVIVEPDAQPAKSDNQ